MRSNPIEPKNLSVHGEKVANTEEKAGRPKQGNLSFSHIIVCSPEIALGEGRVLPDALVLPLEIHSYFPNIILTLLVS